MSLENMPVLYDILHADGKYFVVYCPELRGMRIACRLHKQLFKLKLEKSVPLETVATHTWTYQLAPSVVNINQ